MNYREKKLIFKKLCKKGFKPDHVAEVGVYYPETSNILDYAMMGVRTTYVEPNQGSIKRIKEFFAGKDNITLHEVAIFERNQKISLVHREASTFVSTLSASPAIVNDRYQLDEKDMFEVDAVTFDKIDDGTIDLLSVDVEGSEWYVLQNLLSRPAVISIETHGAIYKNPNLDKIYAWMRENGYVIWYKDRSDSVFVKNDVIALSMYDKLAYLLHEVYLCVRTAKKIFRKKFKNYFGSTTG